MGGQGTVLRARRGGRLYTVKLLSLASDDWAWRELEVRLRLRRVGSVKVLGCGVWPLSRPRYVFLVMPYVRIVVEVELPLAEVRSGSHVLKLWDEDGVRTATLLGVTFPE